ncbi:MAG TPA: hypothetical protein P5277_03070 [Candidatus Paceibacterota bacterium]|nr:hypothetical protein [Candidatus Paceibacterota bacterium]
MHKKRLNSSKVWPIPRKGKKYIVVPSHNPKNGIPLLVLIRDVMKLVKTRKELKRILKERNIQVNGNDVKEDNLSLLLFDTIKLKPNNKCYRIVYDKNKKLDVKEINEKESNEKITKVANKKILSGGMVQLNFNDGRNLLSKEKINVGDSVLINMKERKIEKVLPVKEKSNVLIIKGKHLGYTGIINHLGKEKSTIKINEKDFEINNKDLMVI